MKYIVGKYLSVEILVTQVCIANPQWFIINWNGNDLKNILKCKLIPCNVQQYI